MQPKAYVMRIDDLNRSDLLLQLCSSGAFVPLKAILHILSGEGIAIVKLHALTQIEVISETVLALVPLRRETWSHHVARHGFHQSVMHSIQKHKGCDHTRCLCRV